MIGRLAIGTVLQDRYEITNVLTNRRTGSIYKANDRRFKNKQWAVKELVMDFIDKAEKKDFLLLFQQEANILLDLNHPNLIKVIDYFEYKNAHYLVMEYVDGINLEQILNSTDGFLAVETVFNWCNQLFDVLEYLHNRPQPIIFRDLKPTNIMQTSDGQIKLIDFGIARKYTEGKETDTIITGTPGFSPPEQYGSGQTDDRSDIYALGATLHYLLTKRKPILGIFTFPPIDTFNPDVSNAIDQFVRKAVELIPEDRYQSVAEMRKELKFLSLLET